MFTNEACPLCAEQSLIDGECLGQTSKQPLLVSAGLFTRPSNRTCALAVGLTDRVLARDSCPVIRRLVQLGVYRKLRNCGVMQLRIVARLKYLV